MVGKDDLFNKGINPFGVQMQELKTVKDLARRLDLLKENYEKVRFFFMFLSFIFMT